MRSMKQQEWGRKVTTFNRGRLAVVRILSACELCEDLSRPQSLFGMHASLPLTQPAQSRYDMSAYILYQNQTIPEKWGGSLGEQACLLECGMPCELSG